MAGACREQLGQVVYDELTERLGIEGDSEEFIAAMKKERQMVGL
jgi:hypothetical protein